MSNGFHFLPGSGLPDPTAGPARRLAFFDVDETLITAKSMFDFLRHWLARDGDDGVRRYEREHGRLRTAAASGLPRTEINRAYYRLFAGVARAELTAAGAQWYAAYRARPDAFVAASVAALTAHRSAGDRVVLVSGSFRACLEPLAADLGADLVLCSEPVVADDGTLTGEVRRPMIGRAKATAAAETILRHGARAEDCFAYGDHSSDLDLLCTVGHPTVVGRDPVLAEHAEANGWPVLPDAAAPASSVLAAPVASWRS